MYIFSRFPDKNHWKSIINGGVAPSKWILRHFFFRSLKTVGYVYVVPPDTQIFQPYSLKSKCVSLTLIVYCTWVSFYSNKSWKNWRPILSHFFFLFFFRSVVFSRLALNCVFIIIFYRFFLVLQTPKINLKFIFSSWNQVNSIPIFLFS